MGDTGKFEEEFSIEKTTPGGGAPSLPQEIRAALTPEELAGMAIKFRTQGFYFPGVEEWKQLLDEYGLEVVRKPKPA